MGYMKKNPTHIIGLFNVTQDETNPDKWHVVNTVTNVPYRTYGTWEEVQTQVARQSVLWKKRLEENKGIQMKQSYRGRPAVNNT